MQGELRCGLRYAGAPGLGICGLFEASTDRSTRRPHSVRGRARVCFVWAGVWCPRKLRASKLAARESPETARG